MSTGGLRSAIQMWSLIAVGRRDPGLPTIIVPYVRAEIGGLRREIGAEIGGHRREIDGLHREIEGLRREMNVRFESMQARFEPRFDHLDRDVAAIAKVVFPDR